MQKVISINLNGHAYQLEEGGYDALREYLAGAASDLASNPDRDEIIADLEQAIGDKCAAFLGPHKSVVTEGEVRQIVAEMGPVDAEPGASAGPGGNDAPGDAPGAGPARPAGAKKLYRIREGAMISGVCTGLAAYFAVDVTLIRIAFFVTALVSQGAGIIAYVVMMFVIPEASTPEERAAAGGPTFNARDIVDRAKKQAAAGAKQMRMSWRRQQRQWRRHAAGMPYARPASAATAGLAATFAFLHFALFFAAIAALVSLVNHEHVLGWELDPDVPLWAGVLILLFAYQILATPLRAGASWAGPGTAAGFWSAAIWLVGLAFAFWIATNHMPEVREFMTRMPDLIRDFFEDVREWFDARRA